MATSGTTNWNPALSDIVIESYERIGMAESALEQRHIVSARRSMNFILQDWSGNKGGPNLWAVDLIYMPLVPGQATYVLPPDTVNLLDVFLRQCQMASSPNATSIGTAITPMTNAGVPLVTQQGVPLVLAQGSGTFSTVAGSQLVTMYWPAHGQTAGNVVYFPIPMIAGPLTIPATIVVNTVIDSNNLTFFVPTPALQTAANQGETPLFATTSGSANVSIYLYNHGLIPGDSFTTQVPVTVGGLTIPAATYTVASVTNSFTFVIDPALGNASSTAAVFENSGQFQVTEMQTNVQPTDYIMWGISRTEYASLPNKPLQGRPTTFWLDRVNPPQITIWEVPPTPQNGGPVTSPFCLGLYRMRQIQDANPINGQTADMPVRAVKALASALTAELALKFAPEKYPMMAQIAMADWQHLSVDDTEHVPLFIVPGLDRLWW